MEANSSVWTSLCGCSVPMNRLLFITGLPVFKGGKTMAMHFLFFESKDVLDMGRMAKHWP
ncbi:hypothetical protein BD408DRAFT_416647 [Parasitella parasitica]|nr:hypothetical protein BD408DRAFT_416647 [Parasitella parasitica]